MAMIAGKVMMDRNALASVPDTHNRAMTTARRLSEMAWLRAASYAITRASPSPRRPEQLAMTGQLARTPDCHIQTHLSENRDEIAYTLSLYPGRATISTSTKLRFLERQAASAIPSTSSLREIALIETGSRVIFNARPRTCFSARAF